MAAARVGSSDSREAMVSSSSAVTPNARRIESACRARVTESIVPIGSFRNSTMVRIYVESLISLKIGSDRQPTPMAIVNRMSGARLRFTLMGME